jgi:hypothetical protein
MIYAPLVLLAAKPVPAALQPGGVDRGHREGFRYHRESHVVFAVPRPGPEHTAQG